MKEDKTYIDAGVRVTGLRIVGFDFIPPVQRLSLRLIQVEGRRVQRLQVSFLLR